MTGETCSCMFSAVRARVGRTRHCEEKCKWKQRVNPQARPTLGWCVGVLVCLCVSICVGVRRCVDPRAHPGETNGGHGPHLGTRWAPHGSPRGHHDSLKGRIMEGETTSLVPHHRPESFWDFRGSRHERVWRSGLECGRYLFECVGRRVDVPQPAAAGFHCGGSM